MVGIHYMGINQPVDKCHICGYKGEFTVDKEFISYSKPCIACLTDSSVISTEYL